MSSNIFENLFSLDSDAYARYRPIYPKSLYQWLASIAPTHNLALDCGTGSGQAACGLADHFQCVIATDNSVNQLKAAKTYNNIQYATAEAETIPFLSQSFDIMTVACAVHWFDLSKFYSEVKRVLKQKGVLAVWTYSWLEIGETKLDAVLTHLKDDILGNFWSPQSRLYFNKYKDLYFPFETIQAPEFVIPLHWNGKDVLRFLGTWSAAENYKKTKKSDPCAIIAAEFDKLWQETFATEYINLSLPLYLKAGHSL